jgi:PAS domain-containing protein
MEGLNKFDRETQTFSRYQHVSTDPQSLADDSVVSIYEDRTGTLWIGTVGGLDKFDRRNYQFTHYTTANGLPSEIIWGILEVSPDMISIVGMDGYFKYLNPAWERGDRETGRGGDVVRGRERDGGTGRKG